ncbi:MAG: T9SS type A sorting domain-containing protein, partial [Bacteroidia bacterium]
TRNICFDNSQKYIFAIGSDCEPSQGFNNQDRTCATVVMKYDTALNLIWRQEFEVPKTYLHAEVVTPTLDGGVLVGGIRIDSTPNPNHQKLFVMTIDSMGNHSASIKSHTQKVTHKAFPNPATDHFVVQWDQGNYHELHLYNQQGQLLFVQKQGVENNLMQVDIASLPPGLYFYRLLSTQSTNQHLQGKILKK